jgi:prephenate dehydratase
MASLAALGPAKTISEMAANTYIAQHGGDLTVALYPTLKRAFTAVGGECTCAVLPIENMVEGYVQQVLDLLLRNELNIVDELIVPVEFSFVANCARLAEVGRVYVQFVTQGQCSEYLENVSHAEMVTTQSNGHSLEQVLRGDRGVGAIVPSFTVEEGAFALITHGVSDYENNRTRFIVVARDEAGYDPSREYKTSLVVIEGMDRPGMLADILAAFSTRKINMVSIMSRPTKESLGKYHFFIDIMGHGSMPHIEDALAEVQKHNFVRSLGSYPRA